METYPTSPRAAEPSKEQTTLILLFNVTSHERPSLSALVDAELVEEALKSEEPDTLIYEVGGFCEASNDEAFSNGSYWTFSAQVDRGLADLALSRKGPRPTKYAVAYASCTDGGLYAETVGVYDDIETARKRLEEVKDDAREELEPQGWKFEERDDSFGARHPYGGDSIQATISEINHARQV